MEVFKLRSIGIASMLETFDFIFGNDLAEVPWLTSPFQFGSFLFFLWQKTIP